MHDNWDSLEHKNLSYMATVEANFQCSKYISGEQLVISVPGNKIRLNLIKIHENNVQLTVPPGTSGALWCRTSWQAPL